MKRTEKLSWTGIGLTAIAAFFLAMFIIAAPAQAVDCSAATSADTDADGFTDAEECTGLTAAGGAAVDYPSCVGTGLPRSECLDPDSRDLFVIMVRQTPTNIPANPFQYVSMSQDLNGLNVAMHEIPDAQAGCDRCMIVRPDGTFQRAIRITESLDDTYYTDYPNVLGEANQSTPNGLAYGAIYTVRIKKHIDHTCTGASVCQDAAGTTVPELYDKYIRHTIAHEIGHMTDLTQENHRTYGRHYKPGTGIYMDQFVKFTDKGGKVNWILGEGFTSQDIAAATLK